MRTQWWTSRGLVQATVLATATLTVISVFYVGGGVGGMGMGLHERFLVAAEDDAAATAGLFVGATDTDAAKLKSFPMQFCNCSRTIPLVEDEGETDEKAISYSSTTCSRDAFARGPGQKVVAFSFYGDMKSDKSKRKGYFEGIRANLDAMAEFYPGWTMRLYFDLSADDPYLGELCSLACANPVLDLCHVAHLPGTPMPDARKVFAMNWRFFPTLDPQVSAMASRDLDSLFSGREAAAVAEWMAQEQPFHFMRDHPHHGTQILGSGWGVKLNNETVRAKWRDTWRKANKTDYYWAKRSDWGPDQVLLTKLVWPWAKRMSLGHDSFHCKKYLYSKGFPTQRRKEPNNFVAAVFKEKHTLWVKCPYKCRPSDHKDWQYC